MSDLNRPIYMYKPGEAINFLTAAAGVAKGQLVYKDATANKTVAVTTTSVTAIGVAMDTVTGSSYCRVALAKPIMFMKKSAGWTTPVAGDVVVCGLVGCATYAAGAAATGTSSYGTYGRPFGVVYDGTAVDSSYIAAMVF